MGWRYIESGDISKYYVKGISVHRLSMGGKWGCCCIGGEARWCYVGFWLYDDIRLHSPDLQLDGVMDCWESRNEPLGALKGLGEALALCIACKDTYSIDLVTLVCEVYSYYTPEFQTKSGGPQFVWLFLKHTLPRLMQTSVHRRDTWNKHTIRGSDLLYLTVDGVSIISQLISNT
jgi:hypothetical protein